MQCKIFESKTKLSKDLETDVNAWLAENVDGHEEVTVIFCTQSQSRWRGLTITVWYDIATVERVKP